MKKKKVSKQITRKIRVSLHILVYFIRLRCCFFENCILEFASHFNRYTATKGCTELQFSLRSLCFWFCCAMCIQRRWRRRERERQKNPQLAKTNLGKRNQQSQRCFAVNALKKARHETSIVRTWWILCSHKNSVLLFCASVCWARETETKILNWRGMFYVNLATQDFLSIFQGKCKCNRKRRNNQKTNTIMNNSLFAPFAHRTLYSLWFYLLCFGINIRFISSYFPEEEKKKWRRREKKTKTLNVEPANQHEAIDDEAHGFTELKP